MRPSLADLPFLKGATFEADDLAQLAGADAEAQWITLPGGWPLFQTDEPAEGIYFLTSGALIAHRTQADGSEQLLGHIRPGEPVGEMALFSGGARTASVSALRDSELIMLSREAFMKLLREVPALLERTMSLMLRRARSNSSPNPRAVAKVFTLVATSPGVDLDGCADALKRALTVMGLTCAIVGVEAANQDSAWFDDVEGRHDVVLLKTRMGDETWYRLSVRQADRIWVLARRDARPSVPFPLGLDDRSATRRFRLVDIVILEQGATTGASGVEWMRAAGAVRLFRWRTHADASRLARVLAGRTVGLVLSGGGARAYAHIGAVRAVREAGLPIDFLGGASMGAVVAAGVALGWSNEEIEARVREAFVTSNPLGDFQPPVVALSAGRRVAERLEQHFGHVAIEDLARPFFAVSSNLSIGAVHVHRDGALREALRASISLPGILPPVVMGADVLVDGAVLNNFPVDVMDAMHRGPTIGVDVARQRGLMAEDFIDPPGFLAWIARHGIHDPPPIVSLLIRTATVHVNPWAGRERVHKLIAPDLEKVEIRDWKRFDYAIEQGYRDSQAALASLTPELAAARDAAFAAGG